LILTFLAVVIAWVFFRAPDMATALSVLSKMADPGNIAFGRVEMVYALFVAIYAALAWFAPNTQEIMGYDHKNRIVGERLRAQRMRRCSSMPPQRCWRSGFSESSSTANSSISGSDEHIVEKPVAVSMRDGGHHPDGGGAELRRRSAATVPARAAVSGDVFGRQPHAGCRPDPQPGFRYRLHGHLARDSLSPERYRQGPGRPLAEARDDRFEFPRARLLCWRLRWSAIRSG
jgi:hypothetical protein